ncbi:UDP-N-acetylglucosamine 1-carboxyvinyltransferase [Proteinivorax hydrogeniformans]|uniref:UDP-N-acetylglucosamine 1-carboxyvinyltransferase n=1 Tax=Proteinivorax hydrogeniformans TaxID=1826727 RepID=A0AAU8HTW2_9FIRM
MEKIIITGSSSPLQGTVKVSGAKNAALPILAASLLCQGVSTLEEVPPLQDVKVMLEVLKELGADINNSKDKVSVNSSNIEKSEAPYELVKKMRASFLVAGPLLARLGEANISLPGGCAIGTRPIDLHLKGFEALGAKSECGNGYIKVWADKLIGANIYLDFPSVGATENIMMAATLAEGQTIIENAAAEPEIVDLANFLNNMGANIRGAGTSVIKIKGVESLRDCNYTVIPDRIEAGTYMVAAAITGGDIIVENVIMDHLKPVVAKLQESGVKFQEADTSVRVTAPQKIKAVDIKTLPYPGFPTDMQPQLLTLMTVADGSSVVTESIFENRFMHVHQLERMGAKVKIHERSALVTGVERLSAAEVKATDLRAGAALLLAGLVAEGTTEVTDIYHIDRGYVNIVAKLERMGAKIKRSK